MQEGSGRAAWQPLLKGFDAPQSLFEQLIFDRRIALRRGRIFDEVPAAVDCQQLQLEQRIEGMLLGVAVGDALGFCTEHNFTPDLRNEKHGTIVDHLSHGGRISDDTQLTFWTVELLLREGQFDFDELTRLFVAKQFEIVGRGRNTAGALARHQQRFETGSPQLHQCIGDPTEEGRGNGGLMRFSPIVLPYLRRPSTKLWEDTALSSFITHGNTVALSSIVAFTAMLWQLFSQARGKAPAPTWWLDEYLRVAGDLELGRLPNPLNTDPIPAYYKNFEGNFCEFLDTKVRRAFQKGVPLRDACSLDGFGSRADVTQTIPAVLYTLMCHADSFESAIIAAVNDTKDNDTIAAIVGAFLGALHGRAAIRDRWLIGIRSTSLRAANREFDRMVIEELFRAAALRFL